MKAMYTCMHIRIYNYMYNAIMHIIKSSLGKSILTRVDKA